MVSTNKSTFKYHNDLNKNATIELLKKIYEIEI
jgi:hypothetical protein